MEFKSVVFNAARDGKLRRLKVFLDHRTKDEVGMLISAKTNGATALVMAARNGHLEVTDYLLDKCCADMEQVGSVTFDGETIEGAPPLWCAAAAGHLAVVKTLIKHGACVNSTTRTNSTPLRAACFDGHFEIVKYLVEHNADIEVANRHGHTCLMIACYKGHYKIAKYLTDLQADVNRKSVKGNTALHDCAESGSLEIMRLLLNHSARMDVDSYGMTPLLAASVTGHTPIVEYLISLPYISRKEKIDSMELLGATYVDKKRDMLGALQLWRRAMEERHINGEMPIQKPVGPSPIAAYENAVEVRTSEQLEELISDPDEMRMQALLVRERILGPAHPDTSYYIRYRGAVYADTGNFERCITLWMYALEMQQKILEPLSPMTQSSLLSFAELFSFMMSDGRGRPRKTPPVDFQDILLVFRKALDEIEMGMMQMSKIPAAEWDSTCFNRTLVIVMHLLCLLCRLQPHLSPEQDFKLKKAAYEFVHVMPRGRNGYTPLHLACSRESSTVGRYPICTFPSLEVVELLLDVGADPNVLDFEKNTPLHIVAANKPPKQTIIRTLLQRGAHIDACNAERKTFGQVLRGMNVCDIVNPLAYSSLKCLAARTIRKHAIPYTNQVPQKLEAFIEIH